MVPLVHVHFYSMSVCMYCLSEHGCVHTSVCVCVSVCPLDRNKKVCLGESGGYIALLVCLADIQFRLSGDILKLLQRNVTWVPAQHLDIKSIRTEGERDGERDGERERMPLGWAVKGTFRVKGFWIFCLTLSHHLSLLSSRVEVCRTLPSSVSPAFPLKLSDKL